MKQIKAIIMLFIGIPVAIVSWIISLPYLLFTLPIRWYNRVLYGEPKTELRIKDVDFELKQKWYLKIAYWFIAHFGKEKE